MDQELQKDMDLQLSDRDLVGSNNHDFDALNELADMPLVEELINDDKEYGLQKNKNTELTPTCEITNTPGPKFKSNPFQDTINQATEGQEGEIPLEYSNTKNSELIYNRVEYELMHPNSKGSQDRNDKLLDEGDQDAAHMMVQQSSQDANSDQRASLSNSLRNNSQKQPKTTATNRGMPGSKQGENESPAKPNDEGVHANIKQLENRVINLVEIKEKMNENINTSGARDGEQIRVSEPINLAYIEEQKYVEENKERNDDELLSELLGLNRGTNHKQQQNPSLTQVPQQFSPDDPQVAVRLAPSPSNANLNGSFLDKLVKNPVGPSTSGKKNRHKPSHSSNKSQLVNQQKSELVNQINSVFQENSAQTAAQLMNSPKQNISQYPSNYTSPYPFMTESNHKPPISAAQKRQPLTHKRVGQQKNTVTVNPQDLPKQPSYVSSHRQQPKSIKRNLKSSLDSYKQIKKKSEDDFKQYEAQMKNDNNFTFGRAKVSQASALSNHNFQIAQALQDSNQKLQESKYPKSGQRQVNECMGSPRAYHRTADKSDFEQINQLQAHFDPKSVKLQHQYTGPIVQQNLSNAVKEIQFTIENNKPMAQKQITQSNISITNPLMPSKKNSKTSSINNFRSPPKASPFLQNSKADKLKADWSYMTRIFDQIPHGQPLKTKHTFTKTDLIQISLFFRRKFTDYEQLIKYEKEKNQKNQDKENELIDKLKEIQLERKITQEKLNRIPELEAEIEMFESRIKQSMDLMKQANMQNVMCLEFNKDLSDLVQRMSLNQDEIAPEKNEGVQLCLKEILKMQDDHQIIATNKPIKPAGLDDQQFDLNFDLKIDEIQKYIQECQEFLYNRKVEKKVVQIDLDNISSRSGGSGSDESSEDEGTDEMEFGGKHEQKQLVTTDRDSLVYQHSQVDSEIQAINIIAETTMFEDKNAQSNYDKSERAGLKLNKNSSTNQIVNDGSNVAQAQMLVNQIQKNIQIIKSPSSILGQKKFNFGKIQTDTKRSSLLPKGSKKGQIKTKTKKNKDNQIQLDTAHKAYEKLKQQFENKQLQYGILQNKYENVQKSNIELEKLNREVNAASYVDLKQQFIEKVKVLDQQMIDVRIKLDSKNQTIKELTMENHKMKQTNKSLQDRCELLEEKQQTIQDVMHKDESMKQLQQTVITLCGQHMYQNTNSLSTQHKKLLQAVFGDNFIVANQMRDKIVAQKELIQYLLNDVILKLFDFQEKQSQANNQKRKTNANQNRFFQSQRPNQDDLSGLFNQKDGLRQTEKLPEFAQNETMNNEYQMEKFPGKEDSRSKSNAAPARKIAPAINPGGGEDKKDSIKDNTSEFMLFDDDDRDEKAAGVKDLHLKNLDKANEYQLRMNRGVSNDGQRTNRSVSRSQKGGPGQFTKRSNMGPRQQEQVEFFNQIKNGLQKVYDQHDHFNEYITTDLQKMSLVKHISAEEAGNPVMMFELKSQDEELEKEMSAIMKECVTRSKMSKLHEIESPKIIPNHQQFSDTSQQEIVEAMRSHQTLDLADQRRSSKTLTEHDRLNNQFYYKIDLNSDEKVSSELFGSSRKERQSNKKTNSQLNKFLSTKPKNQKSNKKNDNAAYNTTSEKQDEGEIPVAQLSMKQNQYKNQYII